MRLIYGLRWASRMPCKKLSVSAITGIDGGEIVTIGGLRRMDRVVVWAVKTSFHLIRGSEVKSVKA